MSIFLGNSEIGTKYIDAYQLGKIYLGSSIINGNAAYIQASGGTVTIDGDYKIHSFTTTGSNTFTINSLGDVNYNNIEYLIVGGGGAGGWGNDNFVWSSGGGGAGGVLTGSLIATSASSWNITVGQSGFQGINVNRSSSASSISGSFSGSLLTAGKGAMAYLTFPSIPLSLDGASGAGGSGDGCGNPGAQAVCLGGTPNGIGIGNAGGNGSRKDLATNGGGGGGAGSAGTIASNSPTGSAGNGGDGLLSSITGTASYYAAGGGGGSLVGISGSGGLGGGGNGGYTVSFPNGQNATGYGSGGGGARRFGLPGSGSAGIVIVKYKYQ